MEKSTKIFCAVLLFVIFCTRAEVLEKKFYMQSTSQTLNVISELPSKSVLHEYMDALNLLLEYLSENRGCVDFSMKFALFLLNVNLRSFTSNETVLPELLQREIKSLINQADTLHQHFDMTNELLEYDTNVTEMYSSMLTSDSEWSNQILKLDLELLKEVYSYVYEFPTWSIYLTEVNDLVKWMPSDELSNSCLRMLSQNNETKQVSVQCKLGHDCLEMLDYGINFGYALSFKLLYLTLAHLSCGCSVFSVLQDERIRHHLCKTAYRESEYIADHDFKKVDLMAEHIGFCSLDGHAQFLRKPWISAILRHQTPYGYFSPDPLSPKDLKDFKKNNAPSPEDCYEHINPVAVGALSAAVRFVLENYH